MLRSLIALDEKTAGVLMTDRHAVLAAHGLNVCQEGVHLRIALLDTRDNVGAVASHAESSLSFDRHLSSVAAADRGVLARESG